MGYDVILLSTAGIHTEKKRLTQGRVRRSLDQTLELD